MISSVTQLGPAQHEPLISIVVPTIKGREQSLARCIRSYHDHRPDGEAYELIQVFDQPTCGVAWNIGYAQATGRYIHFSADDLEAHDGWWNDALLAANNDLLVAPRILWPDGTLQYCGAGLEERAQGTVMTFTRIPFLSRKQAEKITPIIETHYSTDVWVSEIGRLHGYQTVLGRGYLFTHHHDPHGRLDDRLQDDNREATRQYNAYREQHGLPIPYELMEECG